MTGAPGIQVKGSGTIDGAPLFSALDLHMEAGQWTCLLGGSGVGKTTVLRLIAGLETGADFAGEITASDGVPIAPRVAYMAQDDLLLPWATVRENISIGAKLRGQRPDEARLADLLERVGLADHTGKKPGELSGGQRQRVALARTLMEDKPVILLDEPFSALDARTRAEMQDLAVELLAGRTVLLVTHDPAEAARLGHKIAVMMPGGLEFCTPPSGRVPRGVDDPESLACMGTLLRMLQERAA